MLTIDFRLEMAKTFQGKYFLIKYLKIFPATHFTKTLPGWCFQTEKLFTMAKNTGASKFRKVNVDEYDEENFQDNEDSDVGVVGPNENEVTNFLNQSKNVEALKAVLQNPLQGCKDKRLKDKVVQLVVRVLTAFKASDIEKGVNALDSQTLDILMKYIYRGFEFPSEGSSAALLSWHEKVYAKGGPGCIIRVLTDRKSV